MVTIPSSFNSAQSGLAAASNLALRGAQTIVSATTPPTTTDAPDSAASPSPASDLTRGTIDLLRAKSLYSANAKVLSLTSDITGTLLDVFDSPPNPR